MKIQKLTKEEVQTLQVDAALRLLGTYTNQLADLNNNIGGAIIERGKADIKLQQYRNDKSTIIEMCRNLKVITQNA